MKMIKTNFEDMIGQLISLFSHVIDKDLFLEVYRNYLARRILSDKHEDIEYEKIFITNLKLNCGFTIINKLEGIINDFERVKTELKWLAEQPNMKKPGQVEVGV
jgi:cullin 1